VQHFSGRSLGDQRPFCRPPWPGPAAFGRSLVPPGYGIVAFTSPEIGLGLEDDRHLRLRRTRLGRLAIVRKVGIVDSDHPFK